MSSIRNRLLPTRQSQAEVAPGNQSRNRYLYAFFFVAPGMLLFFLFLLLPLTNSFYYSAYDWNGFGSPTDYVGIENYTRLFDHTHFETAVRNSIIIVILSVTIQLPLGLVLALLVGRGDLPGRSIFRTILFVPYVFSEILSAYIWMYAFQPSDGMVNVIFGTFIPNYQNILWLANREIVVFSIFIVITWKYFGLYMILYMAALQNVSGEVEDAARVDGATELQLIRKITVPLIGPTIRLTIFLSVLGSFQQFVLIWILTKGGPVNSSHTIATYLYKFGIDANKMGYGSAVAVTLFGITLTFSLLYQFFFMRQDYSMD